MAEDKNNEQEKFDFTPQGEGYISLDAAIVNARRLVRQDEQHYLDRTGWEEIVWSTKESDARDDSIRVILQFQRPGRELPEEESGQEEFLFDYHGELQDRQVLSWPNHSSVPTVTEPAPTPIPTPASMPSQTPMPTPTSNARSYYDKGKEYENAENWVMAIGEYTTAIQVNPNYARAYFKRGYSYNNLGQYQNSINDYTKAIQIGGSNDAVAYNNRSNRYRALGQYTLADADKEAILGGNLIRLLRIDA